MALNLYIYFPLGFGSDKLNRREKGTFSVTVRRNCKVLDGDT